MGLHRIYVWTDIALITEGSIFTTFPEADRYKSDELYHSQPGF